MPLATNQPNQARRANPSWRPSKAEHWCEVVGDDGSIYFALLPSFRGEVRIWKDGDEVDPEEVEPEVAAQIVCAVRDARAAAMS